MNDSIKWDGRSRTAERILRRAKAGWASYWGGAPKLPCELFLHNPRLSRRKREIKVERGRRIAFDPSGTPSVAK